MTTHPPNSVEMEKARGILSVLGDSLTKQALIESVAQALLSYGEEKRRSAILEAAKIAENYLSENKQYAGVSKAIRSLLEVKGYGDERPEL